MSSPGSGDEGVPASPYDGPPPSGSTSYDRPTPSGSSHDATRPGTSSGHAAPVRIGTAQAAHPDPLTSDAAQPAAPEPASAAPVHDASVHDGPANDSPVHDGPAQDGTADGAPKSGRHARAQESRSFMSELPFLVLVAFLLALLIKAFLVQAFYIPSGSMQQTLEIRDRVLVNKLVYDFRDIRRGEVVVFNGLDSFTEETVVAPPANGVQRVLRSIGGLIGLGVPGEKDFIKRVIAVPGDRVACCTDGKVTVLPEGASEPFVLEEDYLFEDNAEAFCAAGLGEASCPVGAEGILVPEGRLWVMGDHRSSSSDSRAHISDANSGTVPQDKVIGRAFVIVWPLDRARLLGVPDTFDELAELPASALAGTPYALGLLGALPVLALRRRLTRSAPRAGRRVGRLRR